MSYTRKYAILRGRRGGQHLIGGKVADVLRLSGIDGSDYTEIETDGTVKFVGNATVFEDLRAPATAINPPGQVSDPDWDNANGGWLFDAGSTEILWILFQLPHAWKEGSTIYPHVHWSPTNTNTGNVLWKIDYKWTNVDEVDAGSATPVEALSAGSGTALTHQMTSFTAQTGTGMTISSMLTIKLSRVGGDGTDTYNADALLREFDIHYEIDTIGSRQELVK